jgi:DMSO reductase anchor subunit
MQLVGAKFIGTMLLLGTAISGVVWAWMGHPAAQIAIPSTLMILWLVTLLETREINNARLDESSPWHASARVLTEKLPHLLRARHFMLAIVGVVLPVAILTRFQVPFVFTLSVAITLASQVIERHYFFTAAAGPKMPGN